MISETKQVVEKKNIVLENKLHNRFDIEVHDARTGEVRQKAQAFNVILDQFLTRLFAAQSVYDYIQYGSGQGTPSASDTALFNWVGGAAASAAVYDDAHFVEGWNSFTRSIVLDEQTAVGVTLTEVGIAGATNSALCTHAMLQDMNGNPISIQKTNTDIITIYATIFIHWNVNGNNGVTYVPRSHWFGTQMTNLGFWGGHRDFGDYQKTNGVVTADSANKRWTWQNVRLSISDWNDALGLGFIIAGRLFSNLEQWAAFNVDVKGIYQITGEPIGTGDGVTTEFVARYDDLSDVSVFVDGVIDSNVHLDYNSTFELAGEAEPIDILSTDSIHIPNPRMSVYQYFFNDFNVAYIRDWQTPHPMQYSTNNTDPYLSCRISYSDDLITWSGGSSYPLSPIKQPLPNECYGHKYIRFHDIARSSNINLFSQRKNKIVFSTPPAAGAVITANYKTPYVPKDSNHVYDFSLTIQLGEYNNP